MGAQTWKEFLSRHWELIVAAHFFTVEVWNRRGLQRFIVLLFIKARTKATSETAATSAHANNAPLFSRLIVGFGIPACEPASAIHFNSRRTSCAVCQRASMRRAPPHGLLE
jgi:hypothetical protein